MEEYELYDIEDSIEECLNLSAEITVRDESEIEYKTSPDGNST